MDNNQKLDFIKKTVKLVERSEITELSYQEGDVKLKLSKKAIGLNCNSILEAKQKIEKIQDFVLPTEYMSLPDNYNPYKNNDPYYRPKINLPK